MGKILIFTITLLVIFSYTSATANYEVSEYKEESAPFISVGKDNDFQIFGFSIRGLIFRFIRSGVRGYIAGYEGRWQVPEECIDQEFQNHISLRAWEAFTTVFTFWKHSSDVILNRIILFVIAMADELMNDCADGKILVDLFQLFNRTGSIWRFALAIFLHSLYTFPFLLVWGTISVVFSSVFCFWVGGFGLGQFLNALVLGLAWPWD